MAKVIKFKQPEPKPKVIKGYRMSFYSEKEIDLALLCLNAFGFTEIRYTRKLLKQIDPLYIKECLKQMIVEAPWGATTESFLLSIDERLGKVLESLVMMQIFLKI